LGREKKRANGLEKIKGIIGKHFITKPFKKTYANTLMKC
jgi:hypothetical protein